MTKRLTSWSAPLGLAGSCVLWVAGCGGSDVPDPSSDSHAAQEPPPSAAAPPLIAQPAAPAPAAKPEAPADAPAAGQGEAVASAAPAPAPVAAAAGEAPAAPADAAAPAAETPPAAEEAAKTEAPSATAELIALSGGQAPTESGEKAAGGGPGGPPQEGGQPGGPPGGAQTASVSPQPGGGMPANYPGMNGNNNNAMAQYARQRNGGGGAPAGYPGSGGGAAGNGLASEGGGGGPAFGPTGGGGGGNDAAPNFRTPAGAVTAFLNALKAKDVDRLAEASALRAPTEASEKYKKIFSAIVVDQSLSAEEMDELAKKFEGMNIMDYNQAKSSGRMGVIVGKSVQGDMFTRTITVRVEKQGWKVCDISPERQLQSGMKAMNGAGRRR